MSEFLNLTPLARPMWTSRPDYGAQLEILVAYLYNHIIRPGAIVVDGGANAGLHAWPLASLSSPGGRAVCFEPEPNTCAALRTNLADLIASGNAEVHQKALGNTSGSARFTVDTQHTATSRITISSDALVAGQEVIDVEVVTLDDVLPKESVDFIKLDLEGYDFNGIRGAKRLVARARPPIIFENGRGGAAWRYAYSESDFHAFFDEIGYLVFDLHNVQLRPETWNDPDMGFEFMAIHRDDPRRATLQQAIHYYWSSVSDRELITEWPVCVRLCSDPVRYVGRRFDGKSMA